MNFSITKFSDLVEELVIQYITDVTKSALEFGRPGKISLEDLAYVIRNDKRKGLHEKFSEQLKFLQFFMTSFFLMRQNFFLELPHYRIRQTIAQSTRLDE